MRATLADMRALGYCMRGCRRWIERQGLDWAETRTAGVSVHVLRATNDPMAQRLADYVEARRG